jgi:hypothetical protein
MNEFMFRGQEIQRMQAALESKESILLVGIRRTGKTQLLKEIVRRHNNDSGKAGKAVYLDVSDYHSLHRFYGDLLANMPAPLLQRMADLLKSAGSIPDQLMRWLSSHINKVSVPVIGGGIDLRKPEDKADITRYWEPIAQAMLTSLEDPSVSKDIAFFAIDEVPFMIQNLLNYKVSVDEITVAMATLRKLRTGGVPMLLSGSISLDNLLSRLNISHIVLGGLQRENLLPFSPEEARAYLNKHLNSPTAIDVVLANLPDYVPHFLYQSVYFLRGLPLSDRKNAEVVKAAMHNQVIPAIRRSFNEQFRERLDSNYPGEELNCAEQILDQLAQAGKEGAPIDTRQFSSRDHRLALTKLIYDMFIEEAPGHGYRFTLNILRLWWRNQRGMTEQTAKP